MYFIMSNRIHSLTSESDCHNLSWRVSVLRGSTVFKNTYESLSVKLIRFFWCNREFRSRWIYDCSDWFSDGFSEFCEFSLSQILMWSSSCVPQGVLVIFYFESLMAKSWNSSSNSTACIILFDKSDTKHHGNTYTTTVIKTPMIALTLFEQSLPV